MNIVLGVTGGIAAYKACELARLLIKAKHDVRVVMTDSAQAFVTPLTFQALTHHKTHTSLLDEEAEAAMGHIELARFAEKIIIAPASANLIARLAQGFANDLLTTLCLASKAEIIIAPAMNQQMWKNNFVQDNVTRLKVHGIRVLETDEGEQACGDVGPGRMLEPEAIMKQVF